MSDRVNIGELMSMGALEVSDGYRTRRAEHASEGFRILRVADVADGVISLGGSDFVDPEFERAIGVKAARAGDVLLTTKGTVGRVAVMPDLAKRVVYSPQLCFFRVTDPEVVNHRYLAYWFRSAEFRRQASHRMNNTDMAAYINLADIKSLTMNLPGTKAQTAIAEVLGAFDDKIAANARLAATSSELAVALTLGTAPSLRLSDVADLQKRPVNPGEMPASTIHLYSLPAFDAALLPETVAPAEIRSNKFAIDGASVLVSKLNPRIPRIWDVPGPISAAVASTEFLVLTARGCSSSVLWAILSRPDFSNALRERVAGTSGSHQRVRPDDAMSVLVVDPMQLTPELQSEITGLGAIACSKRQESQVLAQMRDALLPKLMSGELRVKGVEKTVEEVL